MLRVDQYYLGTDEPKLNRHVGAIIVILLVYLILGSFAFSAIEGDYFQKESLDKQHRLTTAIEAIASQHDLKPDTVIKILQKLINDTAYSASNYSKQSPIRLQNLEINLEGTPRIQVCQRDSHWSLLESFFFVVTVITTIGYGSRAPRSDKGKQVLIVYAFFGVIMTGLFISIVTRRIKLNNQKLSIWCKAHTSVGSYASLHALRFIAWATMFSGAYLLLPAIIFTFVEVNWSFLDSIYYCFTTMLTIGFGDLVPGENLSWTMRDFATGGLLYYTFIIVWIFVSMVSMNFALTHASRITHSWYKRVEDGVTEIEERLAVKRPKTKLSRRKPKKKKTLKRVSSIPIIEQIERYYEDKWTHQEESEPTTSPRL